mgnify:CR=1 FL=1
MVAARFADTVERSSDGLSVRLDRIEDRVLADSIGEERRDLAQLRHQRLLAVDGLQKQEVGDLAHAGAAGLGHTVRRRPVTR